MDVAGSSPMLPEQKTRPLYLMACENCGSGLGALSVRTLSILLILTVLQIRGAECQGRRAHDMTRSEVECLFSYTSEFVYEAEKNRIMSNAPCAVARMRLLSGPRQATAKIGVRSDVVPEEFIRDQLIGQTGIGNFALFDYLQVMAGHLWATVLSVSQQNESRFILLTPILIIHNQVGKSVHRRASSYTWEDNAGAPSMQTTVPSKN